MSDFSKSLQKKKTSSTFPWNNTEGYKCLDPNTQHTPCTDGGAKVCRGGDLGLDRHDVQIHQVVEVEVEDAAICGDKMNNTW